MKKIVFILLCSVSYLTANAQEIQSKKGENYLPEAGDWAIGFGTSELFKYFGNAFNGNLENDSPTLNYVQEGSFVGKKFITNQKAIRVIANFQIGVSKSEFERNEDGIVEIDEQQINRFNLQLGIGKEWRKGKTRLQGFYGADIFVEGFSSKIILSNEDGVEGSEEQKLSGGLGINGFIGAEYFIFPKMALGAQYTYGANFRFLGDNIRKNPDDMQTDTFSGNGFNIGGVGITSIILTLHF